MGNVLKWKNMYFDEKIGKTCSFGPVLCFILDRFYMYIEKKQNQKSAKKTVFAIQGGGGLRTLRTCPQL